MAIVNDSVNAVLSKIRNRAKRQAKRAYWYFRNRDRKSSTIVFIVGCQRSGTTMLRKVFEQDHRIRTFEEFSAITESDGTGIRLRPLSEVKDVFDAAPEPVLVAKPLVESQNTKELLSYFNNAKAIWAYRDYRDVVNSSLRKFSSQVETCRIMLDGGPDDWRSQAVPADARQLLSQHYDPGMSRADAAAIFWVARNALYFELGLPECPDVYLWSYDRFVQNPDVISLYTRLGLSHPRKVRIGHVNAASVGSGKGLSLSPDVEHACELLLEKLDRVGSKA